MGPDLKIIYNSKKGIQRERNQDRIFIFERNGHSLFIVFDGVSSKSSSYIFINAFKRTLKHNLDKIDNDGNNLNFLLFKTHHEVLALEIDGLSTISLLYINKKNNKAAYLNIGDSRIYSFNNQFLEKITIDDSLVGRENILTRCIGINALSVEDFTVNELEFQYNYLICTDGFYKLMEGNLKAYFETLNFKNVNNIKRKISFMQRNKNRDDSSFIIIKNEISS